MSYLDVTAKDFGFFDTLQLKDKGSELRDQYISAEPFPHIVIDDFCSPDMLNACLEAFPQSPDPDSRSFDRDQERFKTSFNPDFLTPQLRSFFYSLNSRPFLQFLENMTGIDGLIPDPYFAGGGFHQTNQGGHLSVHADFNFHRKLGLERRLNILIYLNKNWKDGYGGELELWDKNMTQCMHRVVPHFNRCVVFSTSGESFHGHPEPVAHPSNEPRRSIALYYYTATWDESAAKKTTQFKPRPNSSDKVDWKVKTVEMLSDFLPPILTRTIMKMRR